MNTDLKKLPFFKPVILNGYILYIIVVKKMPINPHKVGFPKEWDNFFKLHPGWAGSYKAIHSTLEKIFIREFRPENAADKVVFFTGRLCVEDFNEIFLLCANGYGFGALKILRGLYERTVTAGYISKNPQEAELFLEYHFVHKGKMLNHRPRKCLNYQTPHEIIYGAIHGALAI